jgi:signal transduction histidine kinase
LLTVQEWRKTWTGINGLCGQGSILSNVINKTEVEELRTKVNVLETNLQAAQEYIATLQAIQEMARSLTSELNLNPLLHKILAAAVRVTNASAGSLLLLDEFTDELVFAVVEGGGGEGLQGVRIARNTGIAGWVATHQKPLIVDDVNKDDRYYQSIAETFGLKLTSLLCVPIISHNKLIGVLQVVRHLPNYNFGASQQELLTTFAGEAAFSIENARLYENLKEERDKLSVVEDEIRKRLARDLHDGPTQFVVAIIMSLDFIKELIKRTPEQALDEIGQTISMAKAALKQLRTLMFDLRPVILETQGLVPALEIYTDRLRETDNLNIKLNVVCEFNRLSPKAEIAIFAVIQEAVNNAKKYARASCIDLTLQLDEIQDTLIVSIKDDGAGFDIPSVTDSYDKQGSLGMINMQERIDAVNGTFNLLSQVGQGTEVVLNLPLSENLLNNSKEK